MKSITVSVPGKIILMGEHSVVYGKPALLAAIDKRLQVTITPTNDNKIVLIDKKLNLSEETSINQMVVSTQKARKNLKQFEQDNQIKYLDFSRSTELTYVKIAIIETFAFYRKQLKNGFTLTIDSDLETGSGLGSSAALAVATTGALTATLGLPLDKTVISSIAHTIEKHMHGNPSGADTAITCFGGLLWYRKEISILKTITPINFAIPKKLAQNFILIHTGKPAESTGEMVHKVKLFSQKKPALFTKFLKDQEEVSRQLLTALHDGDEVTVKKLINQGEINLEKIGVVSLTAQTLIAQIQKAGGAAKICGGGGAKKGSGIVLAYHKDKTKITEICQKHKLATFTTTLGSEGLRIERANPITKH
ncbi:mevalonate kinase [Candidatus Beckwithbacteria bacterium]|nr:mevalonate kinase [Candidatus Beckwithbacteria bacterium]